MPKGPREMAQAVIANLPAKTGKSLEEWAAIIKKDGPSDAPAQLKWLKSEHKLGHITAQIVLSTLKGDKNEYENTEKLVDALFETPVQKDVYREVLDAVHALAGAEARPCKTYVPFYRRVQFARVKPAGPAHVDLYLALGKAAATDRLAPAKSREGKLSHVTRLGQPGDVDGEVRSWLEKAYSAAG